MVPHDHGTARVQYHEGLGPVQTVTLRTFPSPELENRWREFLLSADFPTHYIAPEFFGEPFFRDGEKFAILALENDRVMAVLTGVYSGKRIQCGVHGRSQLAVDPSARPQVIFELFSALRREGRKAELITVVAWAKSEEIRSVGFSEKKFDEVVVLDLQVGAQALFKHFNKGRKSDIAYAVRNGVQVRQATSQREFDEYYDIYVQWCTRKELEIQSRETMRAALQLRNNRRLFIALHQGKMIAGSVIRYVPGGIAEYSANSSIEEALALKPNALLVWEGIQWACAEGLRQFSMGAAHPFLRHFGGAVLPLYRYRLDQTLIKRHDALEWAGAKAREVVAAVKEKRTAKS